MKTTSSAPRLKLIANLWTLWDHPRAGSEWSLERKIAAIAEAGFDGFTASLDAEHGRLARKYGLDPIGYISSSEPAKFRALIRRNLDGGARRINVQLGDHDTPTAAALRLALRLMQEADRLGVACDIETHRDTCTETPEKTHALAAAFQRATGHLLPFTWDFSHFAVVKHLAPPYWPRLATYPKLIQHARQFHFRPFNGHHCQIPVTDGRGRRTPEFRDWLPVLENTFRLWLAANRERSDAELYACPEMGPVRGGYNLTPLANSWVDAKRLRVIIAQTWRTALDQTAAGRKGRQPTAA